MRKKQAIKSLADFITQNVSSFGIDLLPTRKLRKISRRGLEYYRSRFGLEPLTYYELSKPTKGKVKVKKIMGADSH